MEGRRQPGSGNTPWAKEDVVTEHFLIQHKEVQAGTKSHSLKMAELQELRRNAIDAGKQPIYMIDVVDHDRSYFLVTEEMFQHIKDEMDPYDEDRL